MSDTIEVCDVYIETFTGRKFYFDERMSDAEISIVDIAHALSMESRFGGHAKKFYSVAEHCCHVYDLYLSKGTSSPPGPLAALLHDAHEAYTKDLMKPLRQVPGMEPYNALCKRVQAIIEGRYFRPSILIDCHKALIKACDMAMLRAEARELMRSGGHEWVWPEKMLGVSRQIHCWEPTTAEREFLNRVNEML